MEAGGGESGSGERREEKKAIVTSRNQRGRVSEKDRIVEGVGGGGVEFDAVAGREGDDFGKIGYGRRIDGRSEIGGERSERCARRVGAGNGRTVEGDRENVAGQRGDVDEGAGEFAIDEKIDLMDGAG